MLCFPDFLRKHICLLKSRMFVSIVSIVGYGASEKEPRSWCFMSDKNSYKKPRKHSNFDSSLHEAVKWTQCRLG